MASQLALINDSTGNNSAAAAAGALCQCLGRTETAMNIKRYVVDRDPVDPIVHYNLGFCYLASGRIDDALDSYRSVLRVAPNFRLAHFHMGMAFLVKDDAASALDEFNIEFSETHRLIGVPMALHSLGRWDEADAALAELIDKYGDGFAYNIAYVSAFNNKQDQAFEWLENSLKQRDPGLAEIAAERLFENIWKDPRWVPFVVRIDRAPSQLDAIEFSIQPL